jgi:hypothetical protein
MFSLRVLAAALSLAAPSLFAATLTPVSGDCAIILDGIAAQDSASPLGVRVTGPVTLQHTAPGGASTCFGAWQAETTIHLAADTYVIGHEMDFQYTLTTGGSTALLRVVIESLLNAPGGPNITTETSFVFPNSGSFAFTVDTSIFDPDIFYAIPEGDYTITQNVRLEINVSDGVPGDVLTSELVFPMTSFVLPYQVVVPEPGSMALLAAGVGLLALRLRKTRRS